MLREEENRQEQACQSGFHHANAQWSRFSLFDGLLRSNLLQQEGEKTFTAVFISTKVSYVMMTAGVMFHISPRTM